MTFTESPAPAQPSSSKPPSKKKTSRDPQATELAGRLIAELRSIQADGAGFITVRELAARCGVSEPALLKKSLGKRKDFQAHAVVVINQSKHKSRLWDAFVCLREDIPRLAASDDLLLFALELAASGNQKLFTPAMLKVHLAGSGDLNKIFKQTLDARLKEDALPEGVGYLPKDARTNYLFRLADIRPARSAKMAEASAANASAMKTQVPDSPQPGGNSDFAAKFADAFARLDREGGSHNFVKISDLRRALPEFDRSAFDRGVWQLRKERKFTANSSDGNYEQLSPEDRAAGIREGDSLLIYISRL